jgi:preprotein translocase subunit SecG
MDIFLVVVHVIICVSLILSILLQAGKGGGLAGTAFGGGGAGAVLGNTGAATFLTKVTTYLAAAFFVTCIGIWYTGRTADSLPQTAAERLLDQQTPVPLGAPALPGIPQPLGESSTTETGSATTPE